VVGTNFIRFYSDNLIGVILNYDMANHRAEVGLKVPQENGEFLIKKVFIQPLDEINYGVVADTNTLTKDPWWYGEWRLGKEWQKYSSLEKMR